MNPGILTQGYAPVLMPGGLLGSPTPIAMPDQAWHPEALDWRIRVMANGGDVSQTTMAAVNRFCADIDAAGLRDRFYRLNLFCGSNLSACLVPLYRSTARGGAVLGNATDTNFNFVNADYAEYGNPSAGMKGNGSNKFLMTGLNPVAIGASSLSLHLCAYVRLAEAAGASRVMIGNSSGLGDSPSLLGFVSGGAIERFVSASSQSINATAGGAGLSGMLHGNQLSTQINYFRDGASVASATAATANALSNVPFAIFASASSATSASLTSLARFFRAYSIGLGMTPAQASIYSTVMNTFQASLGRTA